MSVTAAGCASFQLAEQEVEGLKVWRHQLASGATLQTAALHFRPSLAVKTWRLAHRPCPFFPQKSISVCVCVRSLPRSSPWAMMSVSFSARSTDSQLLMRSRPLLPFLRAASGILRRHFPSFFPLTFPSQAAGRRHSRNTSSELRRLLGVMKKSFFSHCSCLVRGK